MAGEFSRAVILDAIRDAFLKLEPLLVDQRLSGVQVTIKLNGNGAVRSVIVEPELRFESP